MDTSFVISWSQGDNLEETDGPHSFDAKNRDRTGRYASERPLDTNKSGLCAYERRCEKMERFVQTSSDREIEAATGYSVELVDGGSLRRGLLCVCCKKIPRDAMQTSDGHRVCSPCVERIKSLSGNKCVDCGLSIAEDLPFPDFAARREIKCLKVFCGNREQGCGWQGELQKLQFHLEKACEYKPEPCEQCEVLVAAKFMGDHLKRDCPRRCVQCEYCSISFEFRDIEDHLKVCPDLPVSCSACHEQVIRKELEEHNIKACIYKQCTLCNEKVLRIDYKKHVKDNAFDHFELLANEFTTVKKELDELKAAKEQSGTKGGASSLGGEHSSAKLWATMQTLLENVQSLSDRLKNAESAKADEEKFYKEERKRNAQLESRIAELEHQHQLLTMNRDLVTQMGRERDPVNYKMLTRSSLDSRSPLSSISSGYSSIDDMDTRLTNLELKVEKVYARDADFDKRTSSLEETVRVLQNTLTDIHPTNKGFQAVVRAGEIVPQDKQQTYLMEKRMGELEQQVTSLSTQCTDLELQLQASLVSTYNGDFLWRIPDVSRRIRDAKTGKIASIYSPPFFTSRTGYKMCIRAYLNGDGMGEKTHLSLFFVIMKGEFDALLSWPFQSRITLTLINQDNRSRDVREVFRANPQSKSFQRPTSEMNVASGCPKFVPLEYLNNPSYVKQDVLYIRCSVDTSFLTHP